MRPPDGGRARDGDGGVLGDRGVSETVGFVLAFALVTASVGAVYATGMGGLRSAREDEQLTNAVRAFDVLADNVADVSRGGAPSRATELKLSDAGIEFGDPVNVTVQVNDTASDANASYLMTSRPLVYDGSAGEVVFSAGATFRVSDGYPVMKTEPGLFNDSSRAMIPLLVTYPRGDGGVSGSGTVLVVAHRQSAQVAGRFVPPSGEKANVTVTVESPRAGAWGRYFDRKGLSAIDGDASDGTVTYQFETDRVVVPRTVVEFEIEQ